MTTKKFTALLLAFIISWPLLGSQLFRDYQSKDFKILEDMTIEEACAIGVDNDELNRLVVANAYSKGMSFSEFKEAGAAALAAYEWPEEFSIIDIDFTLAKISYNNDFFLHESYNNLKESILYKEVDKQAKKFYLGFFYYKKTALGLSDDESFSILKQSLTVIPSNKPFLDNLFILLSSGNFSKTDNSEIEEFLSFLNKKLTLKMLEEDDASLKPYIVKIRVLKGLYE